MTVALQTVRYATNLGVTMALARLLAPEDFGLFAMAVTFSGFLLLFRDAGVEPAFLRESAVSADELAELAGPLSQAFASAGPQDDVLLLSTSRREAGLLGTPYGVTARLFVQDGALQVIVNDARLDFVNVYRGTKVLPEFRFGTRQAASSAVLSTTAGAARRSDWVALPVGVPMPAPVTAAPGQLAPKPVVLNEPARAQAAPVAPAAAAPAPVAATRDARDRTRSRPSPRR